MLIKQTFLLKICQDLFPNLQTYWRYELDDPLFLEDKKIKYLLYNLSDLDKEIKSLESDIMSMDNVGYNAWLRSKHCFVGTVENQAIVLAESKQLNKLRNLKIWDNSE